MSEGIIMHSRFGIDVASAEGIVIRTSATEAITDEQIDGAQAAHNDTASVIALSPSEGIRIASNRGIYLSSTAMVNKNNESQLNGSILSMTPDGMLLGVTKTRYEKTNATTEGSVVKITKDMMLLAYGKNVSETTSSHITNTNIGTSGIQIKKNYLGMAVSKQFTRNGDTYTYRSLFEINSDPVSGEEFDTQILLGIDSKSTSGTYDSGSYVKMYTKRNGALLKSYFEIGSTGGFTVLSPTLVLNNLAQNNDPMLYVANSSTWNLNTNGIRFSISGGLEI
jgi:hypothetical protein